MVKCWSIERDIKLLGDIVEEGLLCQAYCVLLQGGRWTARLASMCMRIPEIWLWLLAREMHEVMEQIQGKKQWCE